MRICFVCSEYPPGPHGGIGTLTQTLARGLTGAGHQVRVIGVYPPNYPVPDYQEDQGVRVWRLREPSYRYIGWLVARMRLYHAVSEWSKNGEIDLVEVPDYQGWVAGWLPMQIPVIARLHGSASHNAREMKIPIRGLDFFLESASLKRADYWVAVSNFLATKTKDLFRLQSEPSAILYNPIDSLGNENSVGYDQNLVVFVGTLNHNKGIARLLEAWRLVKQSCTKAELHVFGKDGKTKDGQSMQAFLREQFRDMAMAQVYFHGMVGRDELFRVLSTARVAVFPSLVEAFALAPLESMAWGCPTIFTKRASGPELIEHGQDGLLVDPESPEEIANAIVRVLKDDDLAIRLGQAGRQKIQDRFSLNVILPQNEAFFKQCIDHFHNFLFA